MNTQTESPLEASVTLAYERGITDGGRHARHDPWLNAAQVWDCDSKWPGWKKGFEQGIKLQRKKAGA